jgi:hypothetical protein
MASNRERGRSLSTGFNGWQGECGTMHALAQDCRCDFLTTKINETSMAANLIRHLADSDRTRTNVIAYGPKNLLCRSNFANGPSRMWISEQRRAFDFNQLLAYVDAQCDGF